MNHHVRRAELRDLDILVELMADFYAESATPFETERATCAFEILLQDYNLGSAFIIERNNTIAGYAVITVGFSMEHYGHNAFLDDLYIRSDHRDKGLGRSAMEFILKECRRRDILALHLEVARDNIAAKKLYRSFGFIDFERQLMTLKFYSD